MLKTVARTIAAHGLLSCGEAVLCAVSGGADSVALLFALAELGHPVTACHFEHGIRGAASLADRDFVRDLCQTAGVPLHEGGGDAPLYARIHGISLESAARALRYDFFSEALTATGIARCATAHHADDQSETLLLRLARGAYGGLHGIPYQNGPFIRPLRDVTRAQVIEYLAGRGTAFVRDETNADLSVPRNRVRVRVLPELEAVHPGAGANLARSLALAAQDMDCLDAMARDLPLDARALSPDQAKGLPFALARRLAVRFAQENGAAIQSLRDVHALLDLLCGPTGRKARVGGQTFVKDADALRPYRPAPPAAFEVPLGLNGETRTPLGAFAVQPADRNESPVATPTAQLFDADALAGHPVVRTRRQGDRIHPLGASGSKPLKEFLIDKKVPQARRDAIALIARGSEILWVPGVAVSQAAAITERTRSAVRIEFISEESQ